ncbi:MAG: hypothetical protein ACETV0_05510 [Nitrososphaeria archaeon]
MERCASEQGKTGVGFAGSSGTAIDRSLAVVEMKEYEILFDTGTARKLVKQINRMAKEGWQAKSIGGLGAPTGVQAVYVLMEREVG